MKTKIAISEERALDLFHSDAYFVVNKKLVATLGCMQAMVLSILIDKYKYHQQNDTLENGAFAITIPTIAAIMKIGKNTVISILKELKKLKILKSKRIGNPSKNYYKINAVKILKLLENITISINENSEISAIQNLDNKQSRIWTTSDPESGQLKSIYSNNIYSLNKNNRIKTNIYTPTFLEICDNLEEIIRTKKNIKITNATKKGWLLPIQRMVSVDKIEIERIINAILWYKNHAYEDYVPIIESGSTLRSKFLKLEAAIQRSKISTKKNVVGKKSSIKRTYKITEEI